MSAICSLFEWLGLRASDPPASPRFGRLQSATAQANALFHATTKQHAMGQYDGHHAILLQVMEAVQQ